MSFESRTTEHPFHGNSVLSGLRILAVDDDEQNRKLLKRVLLRAGAEVELADDGQEALDKFVAASYDVIVLDVMMPGLDGYETVKQMRAISRNSQTLILMLSANVLSDTMSKRQAGKADDYLAKPYSPTHLVDKIVSMVEREESITSDSSMDYNREIDELQVEFLQHHENIVKGYLEAMPDHDTLRFWAHQFAGSAGSFNYLELTDATREIESELNSDTSLIDLTSQLTAILKRIHDFQTGAS